MEISKTNLKENLKNLWKGTNYEYQVNNLFIINNITLLNFIIQIIIFF
jgi:hypothetical protein